MRKKIMASFLFLSFLWSSDFPQLKIDSSTNSLFRSITDTLNTGLMDSIKTGFLPGDIAMEICKAPGDLTLRAVGVDIADWNVNGENPSLKVEVYRIAADGYPFNALGDFYDINSTGEGGWLGYAHPVGNDSLAYPDLNFQDNLVWNDFNGGLGPCSDGNMVSNSQPVLGTKVLPSVGDIFIQNPSDNSPGIRYANFSGSANFVKDEYFAVMVSYEDDNSSIVADSAAAVYLLSGNASNIHPFPGLKFYNKNCSGPSGEKGWHIEKKSWQFQYLVTINGDIPPEIEIYHVGLTSSTGLPDPVPSWTEIKIMATIDDVNPSGGESGVEMAILNWQKNSLEADTTSRMMSQAFNLLMQQYVYHTEMPGNTNGTVIYWWISAEDVQGNISSMNKQTLVIGTLAEINEPFPVGFELHGNYPNPFNPITGIHFSLDAYDQLDIMIFDVQGNLVKNLFSGTLPSGRHSINWDGKNETGISLSSGIYFYRLTSGSKNITKKMMLIK